MGGRGSSSKLIGEGGKGTYYRTRNIDGKIVYDKDEGYIYKIAGRYLALTMDYPGSWKATDVRTGALAALGESRAETLTKLRGVNWANIEKLERENDKVKTDIQEISKLLKGQYK